MATTTFKLLRGFSNILFSFETAFALFLFAGYFKGDPRLSWMPINLTLLFLVLSGLIGVYIIWQRNFIINRPAAITVAAMLLFAGWVLLSLLWAPPTTYGYEKALYFATLNVWAIAGAAIIFYNNKQRLWRFYGSILTLSTIFCLESFRVLFSKTALQYEAVFGSNYLSVGRIVGLGFIIATVLLFKQRNTSGRLGFGTLVLLHFFIILRVGGRGPFVATLLGLIVIIWILRIPKLHKLAFIGALLATYFLASMFSGGNLRTVYRFNIGISQFLHINQSAIQNTNQRAIQNTNQNAIQNTNQNVIQNTNSRSVNSRIDRLGIGWHQWLRHPLFGQGVGSFITLYKERPDVTREYAHNLFVETLGEFGLVGFMLLLILFFTSLRDILQKHFIRSPLQVLAIGFFIVSFFNTMVSGDLPSNRVLFTALGLIVATWGLTPEKNYSHEAH